MARRPCERSTRPLPGCCATVAVKQAGRAPKAGGPIVLQPQMHGLYGGLLRSRIEYVPTEGPDLSIPRARATFRACGESQSGQHCDRLAVLPCSDDDARCRKPRREQNPCRTSRSGAHTGSQGAPSESASGSSSEAGALSNSRLEHPEGGGARRRPVFWIWPRFIADSSEFHRWFIAIWFASSMQKLGRLGGG